MNKLPKENIEISVCGDTDILTSIGRLRIDAVRSRMWVGIVRYVAELRGDHETLDRLDHHQRKA